MLGAFSEAPGTANARPLRAEPKPPPPAGTANHALGETGTDLYQQCEAAALRSDCAAVQRLVWRITRADPGYRARIPNDSPVARCLTR